MKDIMEPFRPAASRERTKKRSRPLLLVLTLALLCVGGMELAFCSLFSPVLFHRITDPVVRPVVQTWETVQAQLRLWDFHRRRDGAAGWVSLGTGEYSCPRPVLLPVTAPAVNLPTPTPIPTPAVTEFIQLDGRTVLTGGVPCVYFNQGDEAWRDKPFGSDPIGPYGCGPTVMAMVVASLTSQTTDPAQMALWAYEHDYWCPGSGSYLTIIEGTAKAFGLNCTLQKKCGPQELLQHLNAGGMAVALVGPGHFTDSGHFILLHGATSSGQVLLADSNSRTNSLKAWDPALIVKEAAASNGDGVRLWLISPKAEPSPAASPAS